MERTQLLAPLNYISEGVIIINDKFEIIYANRVIDNWCDNKITENIDNCLFDVFPEIKNKKLFIRLKNFFPNKIPLVFSSVIHKYLIPIEINNAEMFQYSMVGSFEFPGDDKDYGIITIQNVTELATSLKNSKIYSKKVENNAKNRLRFLSNMSHELRTPLNGLTGIAELLSFTSLSNEQTDYVNTIKDCSSNLIDLINDFLDFVKYDSSEIKTSNHPTDISKLLKDTVRLLSPLAKKKNIKLEYSIQGDINLSNALLDRSKVKQLLINLIGNSIKFTNEGYVKVTVGVSTEKSELLFQINDSGIGISKKDCEIVFEKFEQVEDHGQSHFSGTGLGLSICKKLVKIMKGNIWVESSLDNGSTFFFTLPFENSLHSTEAIKIIEHKPDTKTVSDLKNMKVLVVEDNPLNQFTTKKLLERSQMIVTVAGNGREAIDILEKNANFDFILMDYQMPFLNGSEATKYIKTKLKGSVHAPVIMISANALKEDIDMFLESGVDDHLSKPFNSLQLTEKLVSFLNKKGIKLD